MTHPDPIYHDTDSKAATHVKTSFPLHWYIFFGILEPISVLAGVVYAVYFQEKWADCERKTFEEIKCSLTSLLSQSYYSELIPAGYLDKIASSTVTGTARKGVKSFWKVATQESTGFNTEAKVALTSLTEPTRMALAQLGSCEC